MRCLRKPWQNLNLLRAFPGGTPVASKCRLELSEPLLYSARLREQRGGVIKTETISGEIPAQYARPGLAPTHRRILLWFVKIALSAGAIIFVAYAVDLSSAWGRVKTQNASWLAAAGLILLGQVCFAGLRWHLILRRLGAPLRFRISFRFYYIAVFFNTCFWGALGGDVLRAWLSSRADTRTEVAIHSVILDRVASVAAVAILVLMTAPWFLARVDVSILSLAPIVLSLGALAGVFVLAHLDCVPARWRRWRIVDEMGKLSRAARRVFLNPASAVTVIGAAVAAQIGMALAAYALAESLSIGLSALECILVMQPIAILIALPISMGGWGVREAAMVVLLGLLGISQDAALVLSVQMGLLAMAVSLPGALIWLALRLHQTPPVSSTP